MDGDRVLLRGRVLTPSHLPQYGGTPLHIAAFSGSDAVVRVLLEAGVDKNAIGKVTGGICRAVDR